MIKMQRDERSVWPDDVPLGTFSIEDTTIAGYPGATAHLVFVCPNRGRCGVLVGPAHVRRSKAGDLSIWAWDGDPEAPTLAPSIDCRGCGWHGHIDHGVLK